MTDDQTKSSDGGFRERVVKPAPLSARHSLLYIERTKVVKKGHALMLLSKSDAGRSAYEIPTAGLGGLLLGPGCSLTTEASKLLSSRECIYGFCSGGGLPLWSVSTHYRSPKQKIRQFESSCNDNSRIRLGRQLLLARKMFIVKYGSDYGFPELDVPEERDVRSIRDLLLIEAEWSKRVYRGKSKEFGIDLRQRAVRDATPLSLLNFFLYSLSSLTINYLGYDQNLGILHGQRRGGGLVFDLADVYKPVVTLVTAFVGASRGYSANRMKAEVLSDVQNFGVVDHMIDLLSTLFGQRTTRSDVGERDDAVSNVSKIEEDDNSW